MPQEKSAGIVVFCGIGAKRRYLLLHYEAGHWSFPKGHMHAREDEREAALRELNEETGVTEADVEFVEGFRESIEYFFKKEGATVHKQVVFLLAKTLSKTRSKTPPKIKLSFEHTGFEWLPFEKALAQTTFKTDRGVLQKAQDFLERKNAVVQKKLLGG